MRGLTLGALLATLCLALVGCAGSRGKHTVTTAATVTSPTRSSSHFPLVVALGQHAVAGLDLRHGAQFMSPTRLAIVSWGSSNCPEVPKSLAVSTRSSIRIRLRVETPPNGICLQDLVSVPVVIAIDPRRIDVHRRLTIHLYAAPKAKPVLRVAPPLRS